MNILFAGGVHVRRAASRGHMRNHWLNARFSFSFGGYRDPLWDGFGDLIALNEDIVEPGTGFDMHPHKDIEIFLIPLSESVLHEDNLGNKAVVKPGDVQKLRAGRGIWHSQKNASKVSRDHHLQIWIRPRTSGLDPLVEQRGFDVAGRQGRWQLLVSDDGRDDSLSVDQDVCVQMARVDVGQRIRYSALSDGRSLYLHLVRGSVDVRMVGDAMRLERGDAWLVKASCNEVEIFAHGDSEAEILLFDLAPVR